MRPRRGFTLVEILVALVLMGIVTGAIFKLLHGTQRITVAQAEQADLQSDIRAGSLVVPNELRELNTFVGGTVAQNDVLLAQDNKIRYRAMRGLGFVCEAAAAGATTLRIARGTWTGLRTPDAARDDIYVFDDGVPEESADDQWRQVAMANVQSTNTCANGDFTLTTAALPAAVSVNMPVRMFEVMELELYTSPTDGQLWLGARSFSAGEAMQPVLGPLAADGFHLDYLDANGNDTAVPANIKSIRVTIAGLTDDAVRAHGSGTLAHQSEQLATQVLLRNSIR